MLTVADEAYGIVAFTGTSLQVMRRGAGRERKPYVILSNQDGAQASGEQEPFAVLQVLGGHGPSAASAVRIQKDRCAAPALSCVSLKVSSDGRAWDFEFGDISSDVIVFSTRPLGVS